jgi:hypothetical protein
MTGPAANQAEVTSLAEVRASQAEPATSSASQHSCCHWRLVQLPPRLGQPLGPSMVRSTHAPHGTPAWGAALAQDRMARLLARAILNR